VYGSALGGDALKTASRRAKKREARCGGGRFTKKPSENISREVVLALELNHYKGLRWGGGEVNGEDSLRITAKKKRSSRPERKG